MLFSPWHTHKILSIYTSGRMSFSEEKPSNSETMKNNIENIKPWKINHKMSYKWKKYSKWRKIIMWKENTDKIIMRWNQHIYLIINFSFPFIVIQHGNNNFGDVHISAEMLGGHPEMMSTKKTKILWSDSFRFCHKV